MTKKEEKTISLKKLIDYVDYYTPEFMPSLIFSKHFGRDNSLTAPDMNIDVFYNRVKTNIDKFNNLPISLENYKLVKGKDIYLKENIGNILTIDDKEMYVLKLFMFMSCFYDPTENILERIYSPNLDELSPIYWSGLQYKSRQLYSIDDNFIDTFFKTLKENDSKKLIKTKKAFFVYSLMQTLINETTSSYLMDCANIIYNAIKDEKNEEFSIYTELREYLLNNRNLLDMELLKKYIDETYDSLLRCRNYRSLNVLYTVYANGNNILEKNYLRSLILVSENTYVSLTLKDVSIPQLVSDIHKDYTECNITMSEVEEIIKTQFVNMADVILTKHKKSILSDYKNIFKDLVLYLKQMEYVFNIYKNVFKVKYNIDDINNIEINIENIKKHFMKIYLNNKDDLSGIVNNLLSSSLKRDFYKTENIVQPSLWFNSSDKNFKRILYFELIIDIKNKIKELIDEDKDPVKELGITKNNMAELILTFDNNK